MTTGRDAWCSEFAVEAKIHISRTYSSPDIGFYLVICAKERNRIIEPIYIRFEAFSEIKYLQAEQYISHDQTIFIYPDQYSHPSIVRLTPRLGEKPNLNFTACNPSFEDLPPFLILVDDLLMDAAQEPPGWIIPKGALLADVYRDNQRRNIIRGRWEYKSGKRWSRMIHTFNDIDLEEFFSWPYKREEPWNELEDLILW